MGRSWSTWDREELTALWKEGKTDKQIAKVLHRTPRAILGYRTRVMKLTRRKIITQIEYTVMRVQVRSSDSVRRLANKYNMPIQIMLNQIIQVGMDAIDGRANSSSPK